MRGRRRAVTAALAMSTVLVLGACSGSGGADGAPPNPLAGEKLWVNPESQAIRAEKTLKDDGESAKAREVSRIAEVPSATWLGGESDTRAKAREITTRAQEQERLPVLVAYNLPERDCGQYSRGGAGSPAEYRTWTREVVAGIGDRPAVVVLEPDAIAHAVDGCEGSPEATERYALLKEAVTAYAEAPNARVYVDAGNADWIEDTAALAEALKSSGVADAAGFALNVSNFEPTDVSYRYGAAISDALGGDVHFVVDTSRNGGDVASGDWCNPMGARLGEEPTTDTERPLLDALLWVKQPGDSDGECNGGPAAGVWWPQYAETLLKG